MRDAIGGLMVREVPPDFEVYLPEMDEDELPRVLWWAYVPRRGYTPVFDGATSVHSGRVFGRRPMRGGY